MKHFGDCNSVADVITHLYAILEYDYFCFQGEECEVTTITLDYMEFAFPYKGHIIGVHKSAGGYFDVTVSSEYDFNEQYKCVLLPEYCKEEFLHTLRTMIVA